MNNVSGSLGEMVSSSIVVLTQPSIPTFERFERRGGLQQALIYVAIGAVITGLVSIFGGIAAAIAGLVGALLGFVVFAFATFYIGKALGGTGTLDEVAYSFALFSVPLSVIGSILGLIPIINIIVGLVLLVLQIYLGYLAARSSLNLDGGRAIATLILAALASTVVVGIIGGILGAGAGLAGALG